MINKTKEEIEQLAKDIGHGFYVGGNYDFENWFIQGYTQRQAEIETLNARILELEAMLEVSELNANHNLDAYNMVKNDYNALTNKEVSFGEGESTAKYKIKEAKKGSVTCESCKAILKKYQSYKF